MSYLPENMLKNGAYLTTIVASSRLNLAIREIKIHVYTKRQT